MMSICAPNNKNFCKLFSDSRLDAFSLSIKMDFDNTYCSVIFGSANNFVTNSFRPSLLARMNSVKCKVIRCHQYFSFSKKRIILYNHKKSTKPTKS